MSHRIALFVITLLLFLLELHVTTIPFVVGIVIVLFILYRKPSVFLLAFLLGLILDVADVSPIGSTSLVLIFILFLVSLYQRKFEIKTYPFVFFSTLIGSFILLIVSHESYALQQALLTAGFTLLWYRIGLAVTLRVSTHI